MTYSEDYPSFAGDQTGQLLAEPDVVALSPVTSARVVETQSGYLVVLKKADERLSLSVKRRIGTPPSSHVLLTMDESIQLSRVLTDSVQTLDAVRGDFLIREAAPPVVEPAAPVENELSTIYGASNGDGGEPQLDWDEIRQPWRKRRAKQSLEQITAPSFEMDSSEKQAKKNWKPVLLAGCGIAVAGVALGAIVWFFTILGPSSTKGADSKPVAIADKASAEPMSADNVDKFVRNFVANMLDFNPRTYRSSQVHAMAVMKPELLERYWQETSFPIPKSKLKDLHKDQTLIINKVLQQPTSSVSTDVEMSADLVTPGEQEPTTVRLQINLGLDQDGDLIVTEMKDASPKTEGEE